ncbi:MAG: hypothetical protein MK101_07935 [Phycisphaerales bacterium]|nr:hypothetical protein [Phycisphaerales bacterium]
MNTLRWTIALVAGWSLVGCQAEYRSDARKLDTLWTEGKYEEAATRAWVDAKEEGRHRKNRVIYFLEAGRAAQAAGDYATSAHAFDKAFVDTFPYLHESPEATVSEAIVTTVGNDTMSIYRGTPADRIMLHTLNALNFMAMGDMATARVELNRAMLWQDDAQHRYARAIELARAKNASDVDEAAGKWDADGGDGWTSDSAGVMHGNTARILDTHYGNLPNKVAWSDYCSPFTWHLDGVFRLAMAADPDRVSPRGGDQASSTFSLKETLRRAPNLSHVVHHDLASAQHGSLPEPTTWVYFMTGQAPELEEKRITMPLALAGGFSMPTLALPSMVDDGDMVPWLELRTAEDGTQRTHLLADTAKIAKGQFRERLPIIISQEAIRATGKAVAAWMATRLASQQQNLATSLLALGAIVYQVGSAQADLRSWRTAPSQIQVARIPTPSSGQIHLSSPDGRDFGAHEVAEGAHNILVVSMPSSQAQGASVMPIQLTGDRPEWVAAFDLRADPNAEPARPEPAPVSHTPIQDPTSGPVMVAQDPSPAAPHDVAIEPAEAVHAEPPPVQIAQAEAPDTPDEPAEVAHSQPPPVQIAQAQAPDAPNEPVDIDQLNAPEAEDGELVVVDAAPPVATEPALIQPEPVPPTSIESDVAAPTRGTAALAVSGQASPGQTPPGQTPPGQPRPMSRPSLLPSGAHGVKAVKLRWAQDMADDAELTKLLDAPVRLMSGPDGYRVWDGSGPMLVTTPEALLRRRGCTMHHDAMHAMADSIKAGLKRRGFMGVTVTPACSMPDNKGQLTLHLIAHMPLQGASTPPALPAGLRLVPVPSTPVTTEPAS